jgi:hypothetical protein
MTEFSILKRPCGRCRAFFVSKWFQNLRSGFPLERGIAHLDFNKLMCASRVKKCLK